MAEKLITAISNNSNKRHFSFQPA